jgi:hypothetical protein
MMHAGTQGTDRDRRPADMPIERSADHPMFELGGNAITSFAVVPSEIVTEGAS